MAFARLIVNDTPNAIVDQLRYTQNTILFMLETAAASITAGATAEQVLTTWAEGIAAGADTNPAATANIVSTNREVVLVQATPGIPRYAGTGRGDSLKAVTTTSKNV